MDKIITARFLTFFVAGFAAIISTWIFDKQK
jgi:hypothetical protein